MCVGLAPIVLEYHINERECGMIKLLENKKTQSHAKC